MLISSKNIFECRDFFNFVFFEWLLLFWFQVFPNRLDMLAYTREGIRACEVKLERQQSNEPNILFEDGMGKGTWNTKHLDNKATREQDNKRTKQQDNNVTK